jgi:TetR/AcrR family transcriptional regulator, transcriptional repressor for nem operon
MKATLDQIVAEARELFRERGYAGASMQDLADRVGLRKPSLYTRFPNKESLVPEVLALTLDETFADLHEESSEWIVEYEAIIRRIAVTLSDRQRCIGLHLAYGVSGETPLAATAVREYFAALRDRIARVLARGVGADRAEDLATDALVRLEGATLWIITSSDVRPMERAVSSLIDEAKRLSL